MIEFGQSVQSIAHGKAALDKVMNSYALTRPKPSKSRPPEPLLCSCRDAAFQWPKTPTSSPSSTSFQLTIEEFFIPKHQIVGITGRSGSGKTSLLYSLLGHTQLIRGVVRQKDRMAFFPKEPVLIAGSLKENILMGAEFNPQR
jgi:ATP-binding cassette, subfamily C (CFTR/MRP), member 10